VPYRTVTINRRFTTRRWPRIANLPIRASRTAAPLLASAVLMCRGGSALSQKERTIGGSQPMKRFSACMRLKGIACAAATVNNALQDRRRLLQQFINQYTDRQT
jgi:hypothetical protein